MKPKAVRKARNAVRTVRKTPTPQRQHRWWIVVERVGEGWIVYDSSGQEWGPYAERDDEGAQLAHPETWTRVLDGITEAAGEGGSKHDCQRVWWGVRDLRAPPHECECRVCGRGCQPVDDEDLLLYQRAGEDV